MLFTFRSWMKRATTPTQRRSYDLRVEELQARVTPSGSPVFLTTSPVKQIVINGTESGDHATATQSASGLVVNLNGADYHFNNTSIDGARILFYGKGGNDVFSTNTSLRVFAFGGAGNDTLSGGSSADFLDGGAGGDSLSGNGGDDTLLGGAANDRLRGGAGNDTLRGGDGADLLSGDQGNDALNGDNGDDRCSGGAGNDGVRGGAGNDILSGDQGNDSVNGDDGDDSVSGGDGNDVLNGSNGRDSLHGGAGNDVLNGGTGDDSLSGDAGNDSLNGDTGDDSLHGGEGNDNVNGGDGSDNLNGDAGDDSLNGGSGNDTLNGGSGNDHVVSSSGNDTETETEEAEFKVDLAPFLVGSNDAGEAEFYAAGNQLRVQLEHLLPNALHTVHLNGVLLGSVTTDSFGRADETLTLAAPVVNGDTLTVRDGAAMVLLQGTFVV